VATGILRSPEAPEPGALRPLARALLDLAIALAAEGDENDREAR